MKSKRPYGMPPPYNPRYDFNTFVQRIKHLDLDQMIMKVGSWAGTARNESYDRPGAISARDSGSLEFASRLDDLLFFLGQGALPGGGRSPDAGIYKEIAELLVAKGQFKKEILDLFK
jgi:hypothetical protein